jgi:DNA-binding CsgD family transcriptional regulator
MFEHIGAAAFAARTRRALQEAGATPRRGSPKAAVGLTDQEAQIAHLAGAGLTNPEIGAQLFLSPHTVEWHLRKVYTKLDIHSRRQLPERLARERGTAAPI